MTIVDRVVERIKEQPLGDLIQEEDLYEIIKEAIPKAFFERQIVKDTYGRENGTKDPIIVEVLRDLLKDNVTIAVKEWMSENSELVVDYWKKVMDEGLMTYVQKVQDEVATSHIRTAMQSWVNNINQERNRQGLPPIYI